MRTSRPVTPGRTHLTRFQKVSPAVFNRLGDRRQPRGRRREMNSRLGVYRMKRESGLPARSSGRRRAAASRRGGNIGILTEADPRSREVLRLIILLGFTVVFSRHPSED